ncbi:hypothetical protein GCM10020001_024770 [Nonomuraea salmonea]
MRLQVRGNADAGGWRGGAVGGWRWGFGLGGLVGKKGGRGGVRAGLSCLGMVATLLHEIPLQGGDVTDGVVRVGDTVRRPASTSTPAVHALLRHLEAAGFDGAPRVLGFDGFGREVLTFLPGTTGLRLESVSDEALAGLAELVRRFHDATVGFPLTMDGWEGGRMTTKRRKSLGIVI